MNLTLLLWKSLKADGINYCIFCGVVKYLRYVILKKTKKHFKEMLPFCGVTKELRERV